MLRQSTSRLLRSGFSGVRSRPFATEAYEIPAGDEDFIAAWKKINPTIDPPNTPRKFMKPRPATQASIPSKLTLNFVLPYSSELAKQVDMVIVPATTGQMGILPGYIPTIAELKPGVLSVHDGSDVKKYFVSSGFAFVHENSTTDIVAVEGVPIEQIDPAAVQKGLAEFTQKLSSATTEVEKAEAQIGVDVHSALNSALTG